jgi:hypothetical protein
MKPAQQLDPNLKAWLDNVIIPALLREYLTELQAQNALAFHRDPGVVSVSESEETILTRET